MHAHRQGHIQRLATAKCGRTFTPCIACDVAVVGRRIVGTDIRRTRTIERNERTAAIGLCQSLIDTRICHRRRIGDGHNDLIRTGRTTRIGHSEQYCVATQSKGRVKYFAGTQRTTTFRPCVADDVIIQARRIGGTDVRRRRSIKRNECTGIVSLHDGLIAAGIGHWCGIFNGDDNDITCGFTRGISDG